MSLSTIRYYWHAQFAKKYFKANIQTIFHVLGVSLICLTNVSTWALKLPPSQKSVYLETGGFSKGTFAISLSFPFENLVSFRFDNIMPFIFSQQCFLPIWFKTVYNPMVLELKMCKFIDRLTDRHTRRWWTPDHFFFNLRATYLSVLGYDTAANTIYVQFSITRYYTKQSDIPFLFTLLSTSKNFQLSADIYTWVKERWLSEQIHKTL